MGQVTIDTVLDVAKTLADLRYELDWERSEIVENCASSLCDVAMAEMEAEKQRLIVRMVESLLTI